MSYLILNGGPFDGCEKVGPALARVAPKSYLTNLFHEYQRTDQFDTTGRRKYRYVGVLSDAADCKGK